MLVVVVVAASVVTFLDLGAIFFLRARKILDEEQQALGWVGMARPSGISRAIGVAHGDEITKTMYGKHRGFSFVAHEWTWRELGANSPRRKHRTVVAVMLPLSLPSLDFRRVVAGAQSDLTLGWPPFDDEFRVLSEDPSFARAILTPPVAQWLLADPRSPPFPVRFTGNLVVTTYGSADDFAVDVPDPIMSTVDDHSGARLPGTERPTPTRTRRSRCRMQVWVIVAGQTAVVASDSPVSPSHTTVSTSATPYR